MASSISNGTPCCGIINVLNDDEVDGGYLIWLICRLESPSWSTKTIFITSHVFAFCGTHISVQISMIHAVLPRILEPLNDRRVDSLFWLAYATAANTSISRSLTTGEVLDKVNTSSRVSKNLRDSICCVKISDEFRSIIAHSCTEQHDQ